MKILIFTCLCQRATHRRDAALHPLQMLLVLSAAHNEGKDVFLQLKATAPYYTWLCREEAER